MQSQFNITSVITPETSLIEKAAQTEQGVLISGEQGTGKEIIARIIHNRSHRAIGPFVVMNCALQGDILESEFEAKVIAAANGTLYFEEVSELPLHLQARLIQNNQSFRVIASTSVNLQGMVQEKCFRSDLLSKISIVSMNIPSLRERMEQIPTLVHAFVEKYNRLTGSQVATQPSMDALDVLTSYNWPGNVRELEQMIERIVIVKGSGIIEVSDLPLKVVQAAQMGTSSPDVDFPRMFLPEKGLDLKEVVAAFENHLVDQALSRTSGNKNRASQLLGLNRTTLVEKLRKRGMIVPLKASQERSMNPFGSQE